MRKIDKKNNFKKVNMLVEQRYLTNEGLITENEDLKRGDSIVWIGEPKVVGGDMTVNTGDKGEYIGRETSGEEVVEFGKWRFYTSRGTFNLL